MNKSDNNWELTDQMKDEATAMMANDAISPDDWSENAIGIGLMFSEPNGIWSEDQAQFYKWLEAKEGDYPNLDKQLRTVAEKFLKNIDYSK